VHRSSGRIGGVNLLLHRRWRTLHQSGNQESC
jgi:hypothetical protein